MKGDRKIIYSKIYCFINLPQLPLADGAAVFSGIYLCYEHVIWGCCISSAHGVQTCKWKCCPWLHSDICFGHIKLYLYIDLNQVTKSVMTTGANSGNGLGNRYFFTNRELSLAMGIKIGNLILYLHQFRYT